MYVTLLLLLLLLLLLVDCLSADSLMEGKNTGHWLASQQSFANTAGQGMRRCYRPTSMKLVRLLRAFCDVVPFLVPPLQ